MTLKINMKEYEVKNVCDKFPELELVNTGPEYLKFYSCFVKNINAEDDGGDRVILFEYNISDPGVKYSKYVTLNLSQMNDEPSEISFSDDFYYIYDAEELETKIRMSLHSIKMMEQIKKKFISDIKQIELEKDFK